MLTTDAVMLAGADLKAIQVLAKHSDIKSRIPILRAIHITADGAGCVTLASSDLETWIEYRVDTPGPAIDVAVPAGALHAACKDARESLAFRMLTDGNAARIEMVSGVSRFEVAVFDGADFPRFNGWDNNGAKRKASVSIAYGDLLATLRGALIGAAAQVRHGSVLMGIGVRFGSRPTSFAPSGPSVTAVGTDGKALVAISRETLSCTIADGDRCDVIVTRDFVRLLKSLALAQSDVVQIDVGDAAIRLRAGRFTIVSRLVDGMYPNYDLVVPGTALRAIVDRRVLATVANDLREKLDKHAGVAVGELDGILAFTTRAGVERSMVFDGAFASKYLGVVDLAKLVGAFSGKRLVIESDIEPHAIRFSDPDDGSMFALQMPCRSN